MELTISEIPNYWSQSQSVEKPKFSYDDILSSLNMVVNDKGVLTIKRPQQQQQQQQQKTKPLPNQVKNSYIFNKYFKDYKDPTIVAEPRRIPQTREEYNKMVLEERIRRINQQKRIEQIKSKKLLFDTSGVHGQPLGKVESNFYKRFGSTFFKG
jgi:hypothetical protein